jgi:Beta-propeller repeat
MKMRASSLRTASCFALALSAALLLANYFITDAKSHNSAAQQTSSVVPVTTPAHARAQDPQRDSRWRDAYNKLPLSFEENQGQAPQDARFLSHGSGYQLVLTSQGAQLSLINPNRLDLEPRHRTAFLRAYAQARRAIKPSVVQLLLENASPSPHIAGLDRMRGRTDYFISNDPRRWKTGVPSYSQVKYENVYPGVNLVFYGNQRRLEYDFVVAPGADPKVIQLHVDGARSVRLDPHGNLLCRVPGGQIELEKPLVYQDVNGARKEVAGNYVLRGDSKIAFEVSGYDSTRPLVVDPVLDYSTYLSGTAGNDHNSLLLGIAVDSSGDAYVVGTTVSTDFPTMTAFKAGPPKTTPAVFVTEFNPAGTALLYSTYLGGSAGGDFGLGVGLDSATPQNVYVTGQAFSVDFPTMNALIPAPLASNPNGTAFISKINPAASGASSLVYSSYLGGTNGDFGNSVVADSNQVAYIAGFTISAAGALGSGGFTVTANAFQSALSDVANGNAFLTATTTPAAPTAAHLNYSSYLGGDGANAGNLGFGDEAFGVATDGSGNAYIVGTTSSSNFPHVNALQPSPDPANTGGEAFLSKFNTAAATGPTSLVYSSYLGGNTFDFGTSVAWGGTNNVITHNATLAYATGSTSSSNFPTTGGNISSPSANSLAFVTVIDTSLSGNSSLIYSTLLGGTGGNTANGIQADPASGFAYIAGITQSSDFPVTSGAFQSKLATGAAGDAFVAKINPNKSGTAATNLLYSTYFGGSGAAGQSPDTAFGIAIDSSADVFIGGSTSSSPATFPLAPSTPFQGTLKGTADAFVAKMGTLDFILKASAPSPDPVTPGGKVTFTVTMTPVGGFTGSVSLTCTGAPIYSTCTLQPQSLAAADGLTAQVSNGTFQTTFIVPMGKNPNPPMTVPLVVILLLSLAAYLMPRVQRRVRTRLALVGILLAFVLFVGSIGCGGGNHTPKGPYNLTITGTSTTPSLSHTVQVAGTVQ